MLGHRQIKDLVPICRIPGFLLLSPLIPALIQRVKVIAKPHSVCSEDQNFYMNFELHYFLRFWLFDF